MSLSLPQAQAIALNRFGLGTRPTDAPPTDPQKWLLGQFERFEVKPAAYAALPAPGSLARAYLDQVAKLQNMGMAGGPPPPAPGKAAAADAGPAASDLASILAAPRMEQRDALNVERRDTYRMGVNARMTSALTTEAPFVERLAAFWSNHFALSVEKAQVAVYGAAYEADAIRPHVLGRFEDMLLAVEHHPAMLQYLDQFSSVGPNSDYGARAAAARPDRKAGLNENLAREIMELHTLGVRSGYDQADVTEFARAMTGWTIGGLGPTGQRDAVRNGTFLFRDRIHEPGARTIMGKAYPAGGEKQALAVLHDLAAAPATAKHISTKLARHFVSDTPPQPLVDRMTMAYLESRGDLSSVYRVLIAAPEAWTNDAPKFKSPWDWTVSALRGLGRRDIAKADYSSTLSLLGQPIWRPGSPAGYDDVSASWAAPEALMSRLELAQRFAAQAGGQVDARTLAPKLLPGTLTPATATALAQAESGPTAIALLLVSPEFQRR
jgi:uncharacterized protein (DUF1800 family)